MTNPFPRMNPYIEADHRSPDFHLTFIATCREQLLEKLPDHCSARINQRVQLVDQGDRSHKAYRPDTAVLRSSPASNPVSDSAALLDLEPVTCHYLELETESLGSSKS